MPYCWFNAIVRRPLYALQRNRLRMQYASPTAAYCDQRVPVIAICGKQDGFQAFEMAEAIWRVAGKSWPFRAEDFFRGSTAIPKRAMKPAGDMTILLTDTRPQWMAPLHFFVMGTSALFNRRIKLRRFPAVLHSVIADDTNLAMTQFVSGSYHRMPRARGFCILP